MKGLNSMTQKEGYLPHEIKTRKYTIEIVEI